MWKIFDADAEDFASLGRGVLSPISVSVKWRLNEYYYITAEIPLNDQRIDAVKLGAIMVGPAPVLNYSIPTDPESGGAVIYKVKTRGKRLTLHETASMSGRSLGYYASETEVILLEETNNDWFKVQTPDGKTGYMYTGNLVYVRTEGDKPISGEVYRVQTSGQRLTMRATPESDGKAVGYYSSGTEVLCLDKSRASWYYVQAPDGKKGYMYSGNLVYVRTEESAEPPVETETTNGWEGDVWEQPFRIHRIKPGIDTIIVEARHLCYDLSKNYITSYKTTGTSCQDALTGLLNAANAPHGFSISTNLRSRGDVSAERTNPLKAIVDDGGIIETFGGELVMNGSRLMLVDRIGADRDTCIEYGTNMTGIDGYMDIADAAVRVVPIGKDSSGNAFFLPEVYVEAPEAVAAMLPVKGYIELEDESFKQTSSRSKSKCLENMREKAMLKAESIEDVEEVSLNVSYVDLDQTVEAAGGVVRVSGMIMPKPGDTVLIKHEKAQVRERRRMVECLFDGLTERYSEAVFGEPLPIASVQKAAAAMAAANK